MVQANLLAAKAPGAPGKAFNIACGGRVSLMELLEVLGRVLDVTVAPKHLPPRVGDIKHSQAGIEQAQEILGYRCEVGLEEGLRRTALHFQSPSRAAS